MHMHTNWQLLTVTSLFCKPGRSTVSALLEHGSSLLNPGADMILFLCFNLTYLTLATSYSNRDSNFTIALHTGILIIKPGINIWFCISSSSTGNLRPKLQSQSGKKKQSQICAP